MNKHPFDDDGRYVQVSQNPTAEPVQQWVPVPRTVHGLGIEHCAGCSQLGVEITPQPTTPTPIGSDRPWWFWPTVGVGVGLAIGFVYRSGILQNPGKPSLSQLNQQAAAIAVQAGIPTILWGAPGIGKTSWLEALGETMDAEVFTVIGSTRDPADIGGMMRPDGSLIPPVWAAKIRQRSLAGLQSVLFLDEFSSMMPIVHAAMLRVVKDKIAGDCNFDPILDDHGNPTAFRGHAVHVVCAANPSGQGAQAIDLPPPAANRMLHIDWTQPDVITYGLGLILGWPRPMLLPLPDDWRESMAFVSAKADIATFVKIRGESALFSYPEGGDATQTGRAWPSPRSWQMATEALGAARAAGTSEEVQELVVAGCIGSIMTSLMMTFLRERDLPNPEDIIADPKSWLPPSDRADLLWDVVQSVISAVAARPTRDRWNAVWYFMGNMLRNDSTIGHLLKPHVHELVKLSPLNAEKSTSEKPIYEWNPPLEEFKLFYPILMEAKILDPVKVHSEGSRVRIGGKKPATP